VKKMHRWQLQKAKSRFSEVVDLTLTEGPQLVTRRGSDAVVILSVEDYRRLVGDAPNFIDHLLSAPRDEALTITRSKEPINAGLATLRGYYDEHKADEGLFPKQE
jgi:prevent-host-death family protein